MSTPPVILTSPKAKAERDPPEPRSLYSHLSPVEGALFTLQTVHNAKLSGKERKKHLKNTEKKLEGLKAGCLSAANGLGG